ncbi:MAG: hypothetical protein EXS36_07790 [Pedosphaera sp.]|nr:hypothetical protein [Pedosphaera sp.]
MRCKRKWSRQVVYLKGSRTLGAMKSEGMLNTQRGYGVTESRLHLCLEITLGNQRPEHPIAPDHASMIRESLRTPDIAARRFADLEDVTPAGLSPLPSLHIGCVKSKVFQRMEMNWDGEPLLG